MSRLHKIRFFVLAEQRTGSTLLGSLLTAHPDICWGSHELKTAYWKHRRNPVLRRIIRYYPVPFLEYCARQTAKAAYGLKLMYHHVANPYRTAPHLAWYGWKVISLERRDLFAKTLSLMIAEHTNVWEYQHAPGAAPISLRLQVDAFLQQMAAAQREQAAHSRLLDRVAHLGLVYEEHVADAGQWQTTCDLIFRFLGLPAAAVSSEMPKTWPRPYFELVANYDEIVAAVENSSLAGISSDPG